MERTKKRRSKKGNNKRAVQRQGKLHPAHSMT